METKYDDRPISMYDNLNMTTNVSTMMMSTPKTKQPEMVTTLTPTPTPMTATSSLTSSSASVPSSTTKTNGAVHSTPFADITFKFNDNNNTKLSQQQQQQQQHHQHQLPQQQLQLNGNRNLNHMPAPNTNDLYAMPYKVANTPVLTKPSASTTSTATPASTTSATPMPMPSPATATAAAAAGLGSALTLTMVTTSPSAPPSQPLANSQASNASVNERPLSQHSQSELNETTSHSIAAVKAALNEAKSKFFGLNGYTPYQQQQQLQLQEEQHHHQTPHNLNESQRQNQNLLPSTASDQNPKILQQQQLQPSTKPQPKYQNIPENSALFRNQAPELPPKPLEYQNLNKQPQRQQPAMQAAAPPATNNNTNNTNTNPASPMDNQLQQPSRKLSSGTAYNQISLNDIDGPPRSQTVYMATTVPQNIKANKIAGQHTPTRSSLRHSRMLVVTNKHYEEIQHPNPMGFRQPNLARWLLILQIILGILLLSLSTWIFVLAASTPIQDNPYWCGSVLLFTGVIGLILIRYHRIQRDKTREHCFIFLRMDSYVLSLLSLVLCCVALIFAAIHYCRITAQDTKCESGNMFIEHASCVCIFNVPPSVVSDTNASLNSTSLLADAQDDDDVIADNSYKFEYRDLTCREVLGPWTSILGLSFILNSVGFLVSLAYMVLLACCRSSSKRSYTTVRTSTF